MCRNIKTLFNFEPPATDEEIRAASLPVCPQAIGLQRAVAGQFGRVRHCSRGRRQNRPPSHRPVGDECRAARSRNRSRKGKAQGSGTVRAAGLGARRAGCLCRSDALGACRKRPTELLLELGKIFHALGISSRGSAAVRRTGGGSTRLSCAGDSTRGGKTLSTKSRAERGFCTGAAWATAAAMGTGAGGATWAGVTTSAAGMMSVASSFSMAATGASRMPARLAYFGDETHALRAQNLLYTADRVTVRVEKSLDAADDFDVRRPVIATAAAALQGLHLRELRFQKRSTCCGTPISSETSLMVRNASGLLVICKPSLEVD